MAKKKKTRGLFDNPFMNEFIASVGPQIATFVDADPSKTKGLLPPIDEDEARKLWQEKGLAYDKNFGGFVEEISDEGMELILKDDIKEGVYKLKDLVKHDLLFKRKPWLKDVQVIVGESGLGYDNGDGTVSPVLGYAWPEYNSEASETIRRGSDQLWKYVRDNEALSKDVDPRASSIYLDLHNLKFASDVNAVPLSKYLKDTLLHEAQHSVQHKDNIEGIRNYKKGTYYGNWMENQAYEAEERQDLTTQERMTLFPASLPMPR